MTLSYNDRLDRATAILTTPNQVPPVANPLAASIEDGERILTDLRAASTRLQQAIQAERQAYGSLREMQEMYDGAEAEYVTEAVVEAATAKSGPLGGIPVSSDGYKSAMLKLKVGLRADLLVDMWTDLDTRRLQYEQAQIERSRAETEFSALKAAAMLKAAILQAAAL